MNDSNGGPAGRKPLAVYAVLDRKDGAKPYWLKIGAAFTNRDGSLTVILDAFPTSTNRLQIREQKAFEDGAPVGDAPPAKADGPAAKGNGTSTRGNGAQRAREEANP